MGNKNNKLNNLSKHDLKHDSRNERKYNIKEIVNIEYNNINGKSNKMIYKSIVCDIFSKFEFPCIYLLKLDKYNGYDNIYKFGRTDNFNRRYKEHIKTYNVFPIITILQYIDINYLSNAENDVKKYMNEINSIISIEKHNELVLLSEKNIKVIINLYKNIGEKYTINTNILQCQIYELTNRNNLLVKENEVKILQYNQILLEKDNKILQLENEILRNRI